MKIKLLFLIMFFLLFSINVFSDEDEYFPEEGIFDRVNRIKNVNSFIEFDLFQFGLYMEWSRQTTVYSVNRLEDEVEITRQYVFNNCKWNINEMFILRRPFKNHKVVWVAFVWVNSNNPNDWKIEMYAVN